MKNQKPEKKETWTALVTPFNKNGKLDQAHMETLLQRQIAANIEGVVVSGSTGESYSLSVSERLSLVKQAADLSKGRVKVMCGIGGSDTATCIEEGRLAIESGADVLLAVTPPYVKPQPDGVIRHYEALATTLDHPICLYHNPGRTGQMLSASLIAEVAELPQITMIKEASGNIDFYSNLSSLRPQATVFAGNDTNYLPCLALGARGCISVTSNLFPEKFVALGDAFSAGDIDLAREIHFSLAPTFEIASYHNPIGIKALMAAAGLCENRFRLPLTPAPAELSARAQEIVKLAGETFGMDR